MNEGITRREAAGVLGVALSADTAEVKRRYRRLARDHHPDRGGDPEAFQSLHRAYRRLVEDDAPSPATVTRGRPSRASTPFVDDSGEVDVSIVDWERSIEPGDALDEDGIAVWLSDTDVDVVRTLEASSRAPRSRLNRVAHLLSTELTSTLRIGARDDDRRGPVVVLEVVGGNRRARRALDGVAVTGEWVRTRRSSSTRLSCLMAPSPDRRATAVRASRRMSGMLADLDWPLTSWRMPAGD